MEVFRAETGKRLKVSKKFESLGALKAELEQISDVPISSQILITGAGIQLRDDIDIKNDRIFLFNRELLDSNFTPNIESLNEKLILEPPITASIVPFATEKAQKSSALNILNISDECGTYANLFQKNHSQGQSFIKAAAIHTELCERLYQEQRVQLIALDVALSNLDSHCRSIVEVHEVFNALSEKEISKQDMLIKSLPIDIEIIRNISVHPELLKSAGLTVDSQKSYSLADFVSLDEFTALAEKGRDSYGQLSRNVQELENTVQYVKLGTETLKKKKYNNNFPKMENTLIQIRERFTKLRKHTETIERDLSRVQSKISEILKSNVRSLSSQLISTFEALAEYHTKEYLPDMQGIDEWLREQVTFFVKCKNITTSTMISSLQQISHFESTIAGIPGTLSVLKSEIKIKAQEFKQLSNIRQMPIAYAMTLIEILRRCEYTKLFLSKAQQLADAMANFRNLEQKRRDNYRLDAKSYIPLNISALDDNPPMCEVSTLNIKDDQLPPFSKADIKAFFDLIEKIRPIVLSQTSLFKSQIVASSSLFKTRDQQTIQQTVIDILSTLQSKSVKSYNQIEKMDIEFDKIIEKSFHFERYDIDKNNTLSRPVSIFEGRSLAPPSPQMGRRPSRSSRQSFSEDSGSTLDNTTDRLLLDTLKDLDKSKETIKKYEARIRKLEDLLHTNYQASKNSTVFSDTAVEQELSSLRSRYNELESIYNSELSNKAELEMLYQKLKKSHNEMFDEQQVLSKQSNELKSRYQNLETSYSQVVSDKESLEKQTADLLTRYQAILESYELAANTQSTLETKVNELQEKLSIVEEEKNSFQEKLSIVEEEKNSLQESYNELKDQCDLSSTRCNELEAKVAELEKVNQAHENHIVETSNEKTNQLEELQNHVSELNQTLLNEKSEKKKYDNKIQELESLLRESKRKNADLEKELEVLKTDNEHDKEEKDAAEASIIAENNKLKGILEDSQKQNEEREKLHKQELDHLQKQSDERLQEIDGWKQTLGKMYSAREELEQDLAKAEKLIKDISETINEYMFVVASNESSSNSEQVKSNDNLDPIIMIRKVGNVAKYLDQKLRETSQSLDELTTLKHQLTELRRELQERTEFSKGLSKSLWEYYSNFRTLMKSMELEIPTLSDNYVLSVTSMPQNVDDNKIGLSDSCYAEDLSQFFLNDNFDEQSLWPKDKYETLLSLAMKVKLDEVRDLIERALKEAKKLSQRYQTESKSYQTESKSYRDKYRKAKLESRDKIVFQNFKVDDVVLFFPCNQLKKTYAAFSYNCPHYYLSDTETIKNKNYIIGRITKISEHVAEAENNPFELTIGVKYSTIDIDENWQNTPNNFHSRRYSLNTSDTTTRTHKSKSIPSRSLSTSVIISNDVRSQSGIFNDVRPQSVSETKRNSTSPNGNK
ncbi:14692_t:CDS:10 [Gigaspora margarita]|uniref:Autophagy-related protein 11 n=1 Tax=Gigaspora margarita TaxID=4874 RepID=A0ABN7VKE6_GIGMA|nr:14692_t:CDS:10 [Gigaspora margarita]